MAVHGDTIGNGVVNAVNSELAADVRAGLTRFPKRLSSRFFYDAEGSRLFQQIMHLPEYYLTRSEYDILNTYKADLLHLFAPDGQPFELVELGAGDGLKTKLLLDHFTGQRAAFSYVPVDISADALAGLVADVSGQWPDLAVRPRHDDYFNTLAQLSQESDARRVVLFLGSNVGNFTLGETRRFYRQLSRHLRPGDRVLTGFDLRKAPPIIRAAYNDSQGITRAFNLNLLRRINRELGANFDLSAFDHVVGYNAASGEMCSYLVSRTDQVVRIDALDLTVSFFNGEAMRTEVSRKFTRVQIGQLAQRTGFSVAGWFTDAKDYFADVVFAR